MILTSQNEKLIKEIEGLANHLSHTEEDLTQTLNVIGSMHDDEVRARQQLEEVKKITNKDIADMLGGLPAQKMHCSVMGMEALQAAIANYRGEEVVDNGDDHEGAIICKCFGVTDTKIRNVAKQNNLHKASEITNFCKAGGACGSCPHATMTIKNGLERVLREEIDPEITIERVI